MGYIVGVIFLAIFSILILGVVAGIGGAIFESAGSIGLSGLISALIFGGIGFALGSIAGIGWAIFGAILGFLIGINIARGSGRG